MVDCYNVGDEIFENIVVMCKLGGEHNSGFGVVYLIMDKTSNNWLAIKTLQNEHMSIEDFDEFKNEVFPWMDVSEHPNIVTAFTVDLDDDKRSYLIMEPIFFDEYGRHSLKEFMDDELSEEQILKWSIQFCYAMEYVNKKGYIHGDIKPENILIKNGLIKITDFGLANYIEENNLIKDYRGSLYYSAPELFEGIKNVRTEIYSFGMVMYQMVNYGNLPFDGITREEWINFHKSGDIPELDSDLFPFINKCLEKNSEKRYSSFTELKDELNLLLFKKYAQKIEKPELEDIGNIKNMNRGHAAAMFNDVKNCKKYYEISLANSDDPFILFNYGLDLVTLGEYDDALITLKRLLLKSCDNLQLDRIYFNIARCYHEKICLYKSINYYKKAINVNKNYFKAHVNLANVYKEYGFFDDALVHYKFVLNKNPNFKEALINIIYLYKKIDDEINFNKYVSMLSEVDENSLTNYYDGLFLKDDNILNFLTSMDKASENHVFQIPALIQLFEFHLRKGNVSEANKKFDEIFELSKKDIGLCIGLCKLYVKFGFKEESILKMDFILKNVDKTEKNSILFEKSILLKEFDLQKSINICKSLIEKDTDNIFKSEVCVNLGNFYSEFNPDVAFDYYLKAYEFNPKNIVALLSLSSFYARMGHFYFAEDYIDQGLNIEPNNYDLLYNKARLCMDQYRYDEAIKYFNICLKIKPSYDIYGFLSLCFCHLENFIVALFYLKLALNLSEDNFKLKFINSIFVLENEIGLIDN